MSLIKLVCSVLDEPANPLQWPYTHSIHLLEAINIPKQTINRRPRNPRSRIYLYLKNHARSHNLIIYVRLQTITRIDADLYLQCPFYSLLALWAKIFIKTARAVIWVLTACLGSHAYCDNHNALPTWILSYILLDNLLRATYHPHKHPKPVQ